LSGGGLQARAVVQALRQQVNFSVLTTSADPSLPAHSSEEGVTIQRVYVDVKRSASQFTAAIRLALAFVRSASHIDIVNLHGFSRKAILLVALSRLFGKRFLLTLQTGVQDEPAAVRASGALAYWAYRKAHLYLSVSPGLVESYLAAGLAPSRLRQLCNAVNTARFLHRRPTSARRCVVSSISAGHEAGAVRRLLLARQAARPPVCRMVADGGSGLPSALVFVGATKATYQEIDAGHLFDSGAAAADGLADRVFFVESTHAIDKYFRAADLFVLPSIREGLSIALLEAMSTGLACVATRLPGSTDTMIHDGVNGVPVAPDDRGGFAAAILLLLDDGERAARFGSAARQTVLDQYSIHKTASAWLAVYHEAAEAR
jgi:hypothetical protein